MINKYNMYVTVATARFIVTHKYLAVSSEENILTKHSIAMYSVFKIRLRNSFLVISTAYIKIFVHKIFLLDGEKCQKWQYHPLKYFV